MSLINSTVAPFSTTTFNNTTDYSENSESLGESVLHSFFDGYKLSSRALAQNLPLLNRLYLGVLCTMALHVELFYFQMWKPFKAKEDEKREDEEEEKKDEDKAEKKEEDNDA